MMSNKRYIKNAEEIKTATVLLIQGFEDPDVSLQEKLDTVNRCLLVTKRLRSVYCEEDL